MPTFDGGHAPSALALAHVATLASGPRLDPALRVTLNFHPDRAAAGARRS